MRGKSADTFRDECRFCVGDVGERQPAVHIPDRVDAVPVRGEPLIHPYEAMIQLNPCILCAEALRIRRDADSDEDAVYFQQQRAVWRAQRNMRRFSGNLDLFNGCVGQHADALSGQRACQRLGDFLVLFREDAREALHERDLRPVGVVEIGELHADGAAADDEASPGEVFRDDRLAGREDNTAVNGDAIQQGWPRARGDDDVFRADECAVHSDTGGPRDGGIPRYEVHPVLAEQRRGAFGEAVDDPTAAGESLCVIRTNLADVDAECRSVPHGVEDFCIAQQTLRRDAAPVQTDSSQGLALDAGCLETKLCGSYRRGVPAGT